MLSEVEQVAGELFGEATVFAGDIGCRDAIR
jgi:hypothetical protein